MVAIPWGVTGALLAALLVVLAGAGLGLSHVGRGTGPRAARAARALPVALLGGGCLAVYLSNSARLLQMDSQPATWAAVSLVSHGDLTLDELRPTINALLPLTVASPEGHIYSMYPPGSTFAVAPVLAVARGVGIPLTEGLLDVAAKLTAAMWTALAVAALFVALRRYAPEGAMVATLAFAFGTTAFSSAAQDLWQHGPSMAGLALGLALLGRPAGRGNDLLLGVALGWAVLCRTSNLLPVAVLWGWLCLRQPRRAGWVGLGGLPAALLLGWHNTIVSGLPWVLAHARHHADPTYGFRNAWWEGLAALLVAPSRGLLVYSPFLALALGWAVVEGARRVRARSRTSPAEPVPLAWLSLAGAGALLALTSRWVEWHGGWSYGYRIVSEAALLLMPAFARAVVALRKRRAGRWAMGVTVGVAVAIHGLHVWAPENGWNATHLVGPRCRGTWSPDPGDSQIAWHLKALWRRWPGVTPPPAASE